MINSTVGTAYQNYVDLMLADWSKSYFGSVLNTLKNTKGKYDPTNFFNTLQSIPPNPAVNVNYKAATIALGTTTGAFSAGTLIYTIIKMIQKYRKKKSKKSKDKSKEESNNKSNNNKSGSNSNPNDNKPFNTNNGKPLDINSNLNQLIDQETNQDLRNFDGKTNNSKPNDTASIKDIEGGSNLPDQV